MPLMEDLQAIEGGTPGDAAGSWPDEESLPFRAEFGLSPPKHEAYPGESAIDRLDALRLWRDEQRTSGTGEAIFTDVTTIVAATRFGAMADWGSTGQARMAATALMDLDSFVRSVILYDKVLHLENEEIQDQELNKRLGGQVLVPVMAKPILIRENQPDDRVRLSHQVAHSLGDLWDECLTTLYRLPHWPPGSGPRIDVEQLRMGWETLLGHSVDLSLIDGTAADYGRISSWGIQNVIMMTQALMPPGMGSALEDVQLANFINDCNLRALFNMGVAGALRVQYLPNSSRLPMTNHRLTNASLAHDAFLDVREIERAVSDRTNASGRTWTTRLPVFLTAILARCGKPEDVFSAVVWWRERAAPYRAKRGELIAALGEGNTRVIEQLDKAIRAEIRAWRKLAVVDTAAGISASLLATGHGIAATILMSLKVLKSLTQLDSESRDALINRIAHRDQWFLTRIGDTAGSLTNGLARVQRLWDLDDEEVDFCAAALARMRKLDRTWPVPTG